jgi:hypothetical protein
VGLGLVMWRGTNAGSDINRILEENLAFAREHGRRGMEAGTLDAQAVEAARRGRIREARRLSAESRAIIDDLGAPLFRAATSMDRGYVEVSGGRSRGARTRAARRL